MLRSLISLKPSSISPKHRRQNRRRVVNFLIEGIDELFSIMNFLQLEDIYKLYTIYKKCRHGNQVAEKIVLYLVLSERKYSLLQERNFLKLVTRGYARFSLKEYSNENNLWKQPISLDIQRTHVNPLASTGFSQLSFKDRPSSVRQYQQIPHQQQTRIQSIQSTRHNLKSINCDDIDTDRRKQTEKKMRNDANLKGYLKTVLNAISNRNRQLGYVQGLNCWVKHMYETKFTQQQAFIYSCYMLQKLKTQQLFKNELTRVRQMCYVFDVYLYNNLPTLYYLLKLNDVCSTVYASNWFITLFSQQLSRRMINKIWHLFIIKGWKVLIQFGIAVMCVFQQTIKKTSQDQLFSFMRNILQNITPQKEKKIWAILPSIQVSNKMIEYLSKEMNVLFQDTQIQLWRLEQEQQEIERSKRISEGRFSLTACRPSLSKIHLTMSERKMSLMTNMIEEENRTEGCCASYYFSGQKMRTQADTNDDYSILSACRSVNYQ